MVGRGRDATEADAARTRCKERAEKLKASAISATRDTISIEVVVALARCALRRPCDHRARPTIARQTSAGKYVPPHTLAQICARRRARLGAQRASWWLVRGGAPRPRGRRRTRLSADAQRLLGEHAHVVGDEDVVLEARVEAVVDVLDLGREALVDRLVKKMVRRDAGRRRRREVRRRRAAVVVEKHVEAEQEDAAEAAARLRPRERHRAILERRCSVYIVAAFGWRKARVFALRDSE